MRLLSIELRNFKPFRHLRLPEDEDAVLPEGLIIIRGANSTGKSSLFDAILWCLWGSDAVLATNDELVNFSSTHCWVDLVIEVDGTRYRLKREFSRADGMSVLLSVEKENGWQRIAHKISDVSSKIREILNLDLKQALDTLLVRQGEVARIANAKPTELRKLLGEVYNIELVRQMGSQLENLESELDIKIGVLNGQYVPPGYIEDEIKQIRQNVESFEDSQKEIEGRVAQQEDNLKGLPTEDSIEELLENQREIDQRRTTYEATMVDRDQFLTDAGVAEADERVVAKKLDLLRKELVRNKEEHETTLANISNIDKEIGSISGTEDDLRKKIETLETVDVKGDSPAECPTCAKPLTLEHRDEILVEYRATIAEGKRKSKELAEERRELVESKEKNETRIRDIESAMDALDRLAAKQKDVVDRRNALEESEEKLKSALSDLGIKDIEKLLSKHSARTLSELYSLATQLTSDLESLNRERESIQKQIETQTQTIERKTRDIARMKEIAAERDNLKSLLNHTKHVRLKLVSGFVADYVVQKRLIGIIRGATNPYIRSFTNGQYTNIDFIAKAGKGRGGAGLVLEVRDERDVAKKKSSQLSFGDRTAISLGLRLGISKTMSSIRPMKDSPAISPRIRCVMLDEPLAGLDQTRRSEVVRSLVDDLSFKQIFLITHTDVQEWQGVSMIDVRSEGTASVAVLREGSEG
ncbi:MAG: AAA family ATPase [Candidatus Thorarchaeota archaeon]|nr:MAG: AAA family ATPase [Candidatus Thorarchaeota archaeon]